VAGSRKDEIESRLRDLAQAAAASRGVELVDLVLARAGRRQVVRLIVDCVGGVTIDQCAEVSRRVSADLDMAEILDGRYTLEVSSPGIDRPLKTAADFRRKVGRDANVQYDGDQGGVQTVEGKIERVSDETVVVGELELPFARIREGKLVV
jgi:ribosome maturation factor RimP